MYIRAPVLQPVSIAVRIIASIIMEAVADKIALSIDWMTLEVPCTILQHRIPNKRIIDISSSSTSPDVLYVLTSRDDIFSLRVSTLTLTKMVISGLRPTGLIWSLVCHKEFVYIVRWDVDIGTAVYKCVVEQNGSLRAVGSFMWHRYMYMLTHMLHADTRGGRLYFTTVTNIYVIDSATMTQLPTLSVQRFVTGMAVSCDDKLHVATRNGVHVYTTDGTPTGQSYLNGKRCKSISCTSDGYSIVGMEGKVVVVSSDLISILSVNVDDNMYRVMCDRVDNSLVIMDSIGSSFAIVPQEVYRPPFSLFSLCMSTILRNVNELPISLLPQRIHKLLKRYI